MAYSYAPELPPGKQWHAFVSYTTREEEVRAIKPFVDAYICETKKHGVTVCPVWYDGWYLQGRHYGPAELGEELSSAIAASMMTSAFLSPQYCVSEWCNFEWDESERVRTRILPILWKDVMWLEVERKFKMHQNVDIRREVQYAKEVLVDLDGVAVRCCVEATLDLLWRLYGEGR